MGEGACSTEQYHLWSFIASNVQGFCQHALCSLKFELCVKSITGTKKRKELVSSMKRMMLHLQGATTMADIAARLPKHLMALPVPVVTLQWRMAQQKPKHSSVLVGHSCLAVCGNNVHTIHLNPTWLNSLGVNKTALYASDRAFLGSICKPFSTWYGTSEVTVRISALGLFLGDALHLVDTVPVAGAQSEGKYIKLDTSLLSGFHFSSPFVL